MNVTPTRLKDLLRGRTERPFPAYLNLWSIEQDTVIGVDLQASHVYELAGVNLHLKSTGEQQYLFDQVRNTLHGLPVGTTLQFVLQIRQGNDRLIDEYLRQLDCSDDMARYIADRKVEHFRGLLPYRRRLLLYVTVPPDGADIMRMTPSPFAFFSPDYARLARELNDRLIARIGDTSKPIVDALAALGIRSRRLGQTELLDLLYEHLNPGRAQHTAYDHSRYDPSLTLRSQIVYNAVRNEFSECFIDGYHYRTVNLYSRPRDIAFVDVVQFCGAVTGEYDLTVTIHALPAGPVERKLRYEATLATIIGTSNPFRRSHEAAQKAADCHALMADTTATYQKYYAVSFAVTLRDPDLAQLTARTNQVVASFRTLGEAEGIIDDMNHLFLWLAALPGHAHYNGRKHVFNTAAAVQFIPLHQPWSGTKTPSMLLLTRDHELLPLDLFDPDLPAKHGIVLGTTGSGKSFTTNYLLTNFYIQSQKNHIVIVDIGGSYRKLCRLFGGDYLEIELSDKYGFNPFPPREHAVTRSDPQSFELEADTVSYLKLMLQKMLKKDELSGQESIILERALANTYMTLPEDRQEPLLGDLHKALAAYSGARQTPAKRGIWAASQPAENAEAAAIARKFANDLEEWTSGIKGKMLNKPTTIRPDARMVVFDLQKLQEHKDLQSIILFLVQNIIWQKLYDKTLRKMIVFDECWALFNDPMSAQLVENLYRTARKFNAMVLSISQSPDDFLASRSAAAVLTNSYTKYILRLQKGHEVLDKFGLTPQEIRYVKSLTSVRAKYSEILVKFMDKSQVVRIQVPKSDYFICTTDAEDEQKERAWRQEHLEATEFDVLRHIAEQ